MSFRERGASVSTGRPDLRIAASDSSRYGTLASTRSGLVARISSVLAVQLSGRMGMSRSASSGTASTQYFVQAQRASRRLRLLRINVIEGCSEAMRMRFEYRISDDPLRARRFMQPHSTGSFAL